MDPTGEADEAKAAKPVKAVGFDVKGRGSPNAEAEDPPPFTFDGFSELTGKDSDEEQSPQLTKGVDSPKRILMVMPGDKIEETSPKKSKIELEGGQSLEGDEYLETNEYKEDGRGGDSRFDDFSEVTGKDEEESPQLTKGVGSPKRILTVMPGEDTSVKRPKIELEGVQSLEADEYPEVNEYKEDGRGGASRIEELAVLDSPLERSSLLKAALQRGWSKLNKMESSLKKRESSLNKREGSMDKREGTMDKREETMNKREESMDKREGTFDKQDAKTDKSPTAKMVKDSVVENIDRTKVMVEKADINASSKMVKDYVVEKIGRAKAMVEKADSNASLVEKITSIPTRTKDLMKSYNANKNISTEFIQEQGKVLSKKLKAYAGSIATVGIISTTLDKLSNVVAEPDEAIDAVGTEDQDGVADAVRKEQDAVADAVGKVQDGVADAVGKGQVAGAGVKDENKVD